jgi:hypothetical protein
VNAPKDQDGGMIATRSFGRSDHLTFKGNLAEKRYGWLRLTPAYSVHLVAELLDGASLDDDAIVLDPYCGTGTTALVCAERGIACHTSDINPFLLWLARAKTRPYGEHDLRDFGRLRTAIAAAIADEHERDVWTPPLHQIEKWWDAATLHALGRAMAAITQHEGDVSNAVSDLLKVACCRVMIERSNVSFGHQSMSFKKNGKNGSDVGLVGTDERDSSTSLGMTKEDGHPERSPQAESGDLSLEKKIPLSAAQLVQTSWERACDVIAASAETPIARVPEVIQCDARNLVGTLRTHAYACVITSPPYPNRMSYIRELRPYMYWLGYLHDARDAGELDWQAIGGTWGVATSNVGKWEPNGRAEVPFDGFDTILAAIAERSPVLSKYVHKYFCDMVAHVAQLFAVIRPGGSVHYIVGNSKFYDVMLPVEQIYAALFASAGFIDVETRVIRKRTSKKELYEYVVSARKPA